MKRSRSQLYQNSERRTVSCPYCGALAKLVDSSIVYGRSYGMIWDCRPCDAYVGVHKNSPNHAPLGRLANGKLRRSKQKAHSAFDVLWKNGFMPRVAAYAWLSDAMGISPKQTHIGMFDHEQCQSVIVHVNAFLKEYNNVHSN